MNLSLPLIFPPMEVDGHVLINDVPEGFAGKAGDFIEIEITEAHEYDLVARVVEA